jgi:hypothetical protein
MLNDLMWKYTGNEQDVNPKAAEESKSRAATDGH